MNLKDKCAEENITLAEGKEKYGLTHWNQTVKDAPIKEKVQWSQHDSNGVTDTSYHSKPQLKRVVEAVVDVVEEVKPVEVAVVKAVAKVIEDLTSREDRLKSIKGLGNKSKYWSEFNG